MIDSFFLFKLLSDITSYKNNDCTCQRGSFRVLDLVKVSNTRTNLVCTRCHGIVAWQDHDAAEPVYTANGPEKIIPPKRTWTEQELEELV